MTNARTREIKHAQRESFLYKKIGDFFVQIARDKPELAPLSVTRVRLSVDRGTCTIYFYAQGGLPVFEELRRTLVLYKGSLRTALAKSMHSRYVPQLRFAFDDQLAKQQRVEDLIDQLKEEGKL